MKITPKQLWIFCSSAKPQFFLLPYLMALVVIGTLAQKQMGLFPATEMFFTSFWLWIGFIPVPSTALIICMIFVNLLLHFIQKSQWHRAAIGTSLAHLGVLVLILGGVVSFFHKQEGFVVLQPNQEINRLHSYHERILRVVRDQTAVFEKEDTALIPQKNITLDTDVEISIQRKEKNVVLKERKKPDPQAIGLAQKFDLVARKAKLEDELNQMGLVIAITDKQTQKTQHLLLVEFINQPVTVKIAGKKYRFQFQRASQELPFSLRLTDLKQDYYSGTDIARAYASRVMITQKDKKWPAEIAMNAPLRYKGYTFYQASVLNLPNHPSASVLAVVKNMGWLFPYLASALIFVGLVWHAVVRRYAV